ncbi:hypothetical protein, partial [Streptomyces sp. NPDC001919]
TVRADVRDPDGDPVTTKILLSGNYANGDTWRPGVGRGTAPHRDSGAGPCTDPCGPEISLR